MSEADYATMADARRAQHDSLSGAGFRHGRTQGDYSILGVAMNADTLALEVVYVSRKTGDWWTRPLAEFLDGRFGPIALPPEDAAAFGLSWLLAPSTDGVSGLSTEARRLLAQIAVATLDAAAPRAAAAGVAEADPAHPTTLDLRDRGLLSPDLNLTQLGWAAVAAIARHGR